MKNKITLLLVAAVTALSYVSTNSKKVEVHAETAEESGSQWKKADKFVEGNDYILVNNSDSKALQSVSSNRYTSCTLNGDYLTEITGKTFSDFIFTAEASNTAGEVYLKNNNNYYLSIEYYRGDGYYEARGSKVSLKYNTAGYIVTSNYYNGDNGSEYKGTIYYGLGSYNISNSLGDITKNVSIYEKVVADAVTYYDVTLSAGEGATGNPITSSVKEGDEFVLPENTFTKSNSMFTGWSDGVNSYQPGDKIVVNNNIELTAQWRALESYTITFYSINDTILATRTAKENSQYYLYYSYTPTGYSFLGWTTEKGSSRVDYTNAAYYSISQDLDLYPVVVENMSALKSSVSIRMGENAGLRFKFTITKEQANASANSNYGLGSYTFGVLLVKTEDLRSYDYAGKLASAVGTNKTLKEGVNSISMSYYDDNWNTKYYNLNVVNCVADNSSLNDSQDEITFAGVLTGYSDLSEETEEDLAKKKEAYNAEFTAVGYIALNGTIKAYTDEVSYSYMAAVNNYIADDENYGLSSSQIAELTSIQDKYSI